MAWESPIEVITDDIKVKIEGEIVRAVQRIGVMVNRDELLRALQYDRGQYDKGYADGRADAVAEIVTCEKCRYCDTDLPKGLWWCKLHEIGSRGEYDFCSDGYGRTDDG